MVDLAVGDSIGTGFIRFGGLSGRWASSPRDAAADAAVGRTPQQVLDFIQSRPDGYFKGRGVTLSTGVSNDPSQAGLVADQIRELRGRGASRVRVVGVGDRAGTEAGRSFDLRPYNPVIRGQAEQGGAEFLGELPAVVHPTPDYYRRMSAVPDRHSGGGSGPPQADLGAGGDGPLGLIERYESGGRNVPNYRFDPGHTAQGFWQITNSTWRDAAPKAGVSLAEYPNAMSAPKEVQRAVALNLFKREGFAPWAPFNPALAKAIGWTGPTSNGMAALRSKFPGFVPADDGGDESGGGEDREIRRLREQVNRLAEQARPENAAPLQPQPTAAVPTQPQSAIEGGAKFRLSPAPIPAAPDLRAMYKQQLARIIGSRLGAA